jgi:hypothetical protein
MLSISPSLKTRSIDQLRVLSLSDGSVSESAGCSYSQPMSFYSCPSCSQKRTLLFSQYMNERLLLALPHRGTARETEIAVIVAGVDPRWIVVATSRSALWCRFRRMFLRRQFEFPRRL